MIETDSGNRSQTQRGSREGAVEGSEATHRRPHKQKRTVRPGLSDECASKHEIPKLGEAGQVESKGAAGQCGVLPRETSSAAWAAEEESAGIVVGGQWRFAKKYLEELHAAQGSKSQGDDLNPHPPPRHRLQPERAAGGRASRGGSAAWGCPTVKPVKQSQAAPSREAGGRKKEKNGGAGGIDGRGGRSSYGATWRSIG